MGNAQQKRVKLSLRIAAVTCIFAWLFASTACSVEAVGAASPDSGARKESHYHPTEAMHSHAAADDPHESGRDHKQDGDSCCSSLKSLRQNGPSISVPNPSFGIAWLRAELPAEELTLATRLTAVWRQTIPRDWVFTPEVSLGPAFRSLAPPASS